MKNPGGLRKRNRWQSRFDVLTKESFGKEKQVVSWNAPRIEQKRKNEKEVKEDVREEAAAEGKTWREIKEMQRNRVRWCNFMDALCFRKWMNKLMIGFIFCFRCPQFT